MKARVRGLTLVEILVTLSIMLLGISAVFVNIHHVSNKSQGALELSRQVLNDIRNVRRKAMSTGSPRAFCIPTANATTPIAQSYYTMSGHGRTGPRIITDTSKQCPGTYLFMGMWLASGENISNLVHPARKWPPAPAQPPFQVAKWLSPVTRDFVLAFNSNGSLSSNDLPHDADGNTYIVIADGLDFAAGSTPPGTPTMGTDTPPYFDLLSVQNPYVIKITSTGSTSLLQGLPKAKASITLSQGVMPSVAPAATVSKPAFNTPPVVDKIVVNPVGNPANLPFDTTITPEGRVSLTVQAHDDDGEDLTYKFKATALDGTDPGKFTYLDATRTLRYTNDSNIGEARVEWVPPDKVPLGAKFYLDAIVTDESNQSAISAGTVTIEIKVLDSGMIAFDSNSDIWTMHGDGTLPAPKTTLAGVNSWPQISPNGRQIAFVSNRPLEYFDQTTKNKKWLSVKRIYVMNIDGSEVQELTNVDDTSSTTIDETKDSTDDRPCWSPDGTKLAFARTNTKSGVTTTKIQIIAADGTWKKKDLDIGDTPSWSRTPQTDGKDLLYEKEDKIYQSKVTGPGSVLITGAAGPVTRPVWSPDGTRILYLYNGDLMECKADGTGPITKFSGVTEQVAFKSDSKQFVGVTAGNVVLYTDPGVGTPAASMAFTPPSMKFPFTGSLSWSTGP